MLSDMAFWDELPPASWVVIGISVYILMFALRDHAHRIVSRLAATVHRLLRLLAKACLRAEYRIRCRNHEVSKALVEELTERRVQRQFMRVEALVEKDLSNYQVLAAQINRRLIAIDDDYAATALVPPAAPEWVAAVDAIARLEGDERNSDVVRKILEDIHTTVQTHQRDVLREYRWTVTARHKILTRLQPHWRRLSRALDRMAGRVEILRSKLDRVDHQMASFEVLTSGVGDGLLFSIFTRFMAALLFTAFAVTTAVVNVQMLNGPIALLMQGQPEALSLIPMPLLMSSVLTGFIICSGVLLSEGLRATRFFPLVTIATERGRRWMIALGLTLVLSLICLQGVLVGFTGPAEEGVGPVALSQWLMAGLGAALALFVALTAVPLEYFVLTVRPIMAAIGQGALHVMVLVSRLLGALVLECGRIVNEIYDLIIFLPLRLEKTWQARRAIQTPADRHPVAAAHAQNVTAVDFTHSVQRNIDR